MTQSNRVSTKQFEYDDRQWLAVESDNGPEAWIATPDPVEVRQ